MEPILDNEQLDIQSPRARGSHLMIKLMHIERENANMQKKIIELEQYIYASNQKRGYCNPTNEGYSSYMQIQQLNQLRYMLHNAEENNKILSAYLLIKNQIINENYIEYSEMLTEYAQTINHLRSLIHKKESALADIYQHYNPFDDNITYKNLYKAEEAAYKENLIRMLFKENSQLKYEIKALSSQLDGSKSTAASKDNKKDGTYATSLRNSKGRTDTKVEKESFTKVTTKSTLGSTTYFSNLSVSLPLKTAVSVAIKTQIELKRNMEYRKTLQSKLKYLEQHIETLKAGNWYLNEKINFFKTELRNYRQLRYFLLSLSKYAQLEGSLTSYSMILPATRSEAIEFWKSSAQFLKPILTIKSTINKKSKKRSLSAVNRLECFEHRHRNVNNLIRKYRYPYFKRVLVYPPQLKTKTNIFSSINLYELDVELPRRYHKKIASIASLEFGDDLEK